MCSAVYASPQAKVLDLIVESFNEPWLIVSDFNSILDSSNRKEGAARVVFGCDLFQGVVFNHRL